LIVVDLPAPFGPMKASSSPCSHWSDAFHRLHDAPLGRHERPQAPGHARLFLFAAEGFPQLADLDDRHAAPPDVKRET
jgi:hypothetical protein